MVHFFFSQEEKCCGHLAGVGVGGIFSLLIMLILIGTSPATFREKNLMPKQNIIAYRPMTKIQHQKVKISFSSRTAIQLEYGIQQC